jgi:hypothetical protein
VWASLLALANPTVRAERLSVLAVRRGSDAFFFSVNHTAFSDVQKLSKALALAVLASTP